jgi:hypothetical protein
MPQGNRFTKHPAETLLALLGPNEVIPKAELASRDTLRKRSASYAAMERLMESGQLFVAGRIVGTTGNQFPVTLVTRDPAQASTSRVHVTPDGIKHADDNALPIVALLTPPLPKFRILSTRVMG